MRTKAFGWAALYAVVLAAAACFIHLNGGRAGQYRVGQVVAQAIVPRVEFRAIDDRATDRERQDARDREPAVYRPNTAYLDQIRSGLDGLLQIGAEYEELDQIPIDTRNNLHISERALQELKWFNSTPEMKTNWKDAVDNFIKGIAGIALLNENRKLIETDKKERAPGIVIVHPILQHELTRNDSLILGTGDLAPYRSNVTRFAEDYLTPSIRRPAIEVVMKNPQPLYIFDKQQTESRRQAAYQNAAAVQMTWRPQDVLIPAGTQLTAVEMKLLAKEQAAYDASLRQQRVWMFLPGHLAPLVGRFGVLLALCAVMWGYLLAYYHRVAQNPMRGLALTGLILLCLTAAYLGTMARPDYLYATAVFPALLATMVLAIAYDQRFAVAVGSMFSVLLLVSLDQSVGFAMVLLAGSAAAAAQLDEVRTRSKLVLVGFWSGLALGVVTLFAGLLDPLLPTLGRDAVVVRNALLGGAAALLAGIFVQGVLPVIERAFRVTTAMTLKELNDASHPLLRRLAQEAPGTYQHSLRIADMAEAAAAEIGGDDLLCRVGAMYHDIGKMNKPSYFVENQGGGPNKHNKLSPAMSLLIIVGHVKDGVEMAREAGLPLPVRQFIESHHGTTLVEYFYHAARKQSEADKNLPLPTEFEFRYPGPKPQTREAAILMICDGIEGAARTLPEPNPVRLEQLVHSMTMKRLLDGQFDETGITLSELHRVEQAISRTLCAIYHARIAYPKDAGKPGAPRREEPAAPPPPAAAAG